MKDGVMTQAGLLYGGGGHPTENLFAGANGHWIEKRTKRYGDNAIHDNIVFSENGDGDGQSG